MRKFLFTSFAATMLALFMTVSGAQAQDGKDMKMPGKKGMVEGELVDIRCFTAMGKRGAEHEMCANACAGMGDPVGIVDAKGNLYTISSVATGYKGNMAKTARVSGMLIGNVIMPMKVEIQDGSKWKNLKLPKEMAE